MPVSRSLPPRKCPECGQVGQDVTTEEDETTLYVCNSPGCWVNEYNAGGVVTPTPEQRTAQNQSG